MSCRREERSLLNEIHPFLEKKHETQIALSAAEGVFGKEMRMLHQTEANCIRRLSHKLNMAQTDSKKAMGTLFILIDGGLFYLKEYVAVQDSFFLLSPGGCDIVYLVKTAAAFVLVFRK